MSSLGHHFNDQTFILSFLIFKKVNVAISTISCLSPADIVRIIKEQMFWAQWKGEAIKLKDIIVI